jgi:hypothetical protein
MILEIEIGWKALVLGFFVVLCVVTVFNKRSEANKAEADAFRKLAEMKDVERDRNIVVGKLGEG